MLKRSFLVSKDKRKGKIQKTSFRQDAGVKMLNNLTLTPETSPSIGGSPKLNSAIVRTLCNT